MNSLSKQLAILDVLADGKKHTIPQIAELTGLSKHAVVAHLAIIRNDYDNILKADTLYWNSAITPSEKEKLDPAQKPVEFVCGERIIYERAGIFLTGTFDHYRSSPDHARVLIDGEWSAVYVPVKYLRKAGNPSTQPLHFL